MMILLNADNEHQHVPSTHSCSIFFVCSNMINWANMRDDFFVSAHGIELCMLQLKPISCVWYNCCYIIATTQERSNHLMQRNGINSGRLMPFFANSQFSLSTHNFMVGKKWEFFLNIKHGTRSTASLNWF